MACRGIILFKG